MNLILIGKPRKDGKQKVKLVYEGSENMFGGRYPPKVFSKLASPEKLADWIAQAAKVSQQ